MWITDKNGYRYLCDPSTINNVTSIKKTWRGDFEFSVTWMEVVRGYWKAHTQKLVFKHPGDAEGTREAIISQINK